MESTATAMEKMDGTAFEKLCGPVLRKMKPALSNFIPSGINAAGKAIRSLSDGFCFIDSRHMATVHITTNASDLATKWLYDGDAPSMTKGDLIKGIYQAREIHTNNPNFQFSIFLVYNKRVDEALHLKVHQRITDSFISVTIIEQRDLISFLDFDPEGQYLRQKLLRIDADRLSASILEEIVNANLERYGGDYYLKPSQLTDVSWENRINDDLNVSTTTINLLTGDSGFGKSAFCYRRMHAIQKTGGIAYRLEPSTIEKAISLENAILQQLKIESPDLYVHPTDILTYFQDALIVVDDINKYSNSTTILDKLISWNAKKKKGGITLLCPVWPRNLASLQNKDQKKNNYTVISVGRFSFYDCKSIIEQRISGGFPFLTEQQIHSLIVGAGFDPLLLDLSLQLLLDSRTFSENIPGEAIRGYVSEAIQQVHTTHNFPVYQINQSLILLGREMLRNRKLDPHLDDISAWLGPGTEEYKIVSLIAAQRKLFSFDDTGQCFFRHDRVRDHLLSIAVVPLLNDFASNVEVLTDPYFAEIIANGLGSSPIQKHTVEHLIKFNPLAVYISLKYLKDEATDQQRSLVVKIVEEWSAAIPINKIPKSITSAISGTLMSFDVAEINNITKGFPDSAELQLAKFRNGIWVSGIRFFSFIRYFYPESPTYWWNTILAHVKSKHFLQTIEGLRLHLPDRIRDESVSHAYALAGFLKEPELLEVLAISWKKYAHSKSYPAFLWAILKSCTKKDKKIVAEALSYWSTIPENVRQRPINEELHGRTIDNQLKDLDWQFSEEQLSLLFELRDDSSLHGVLSLLLAKIDHPDAFSVVLSVEMNRDPAYIWHDKWDSRWDRPKRKYRLSEVSLQFLEDEFSKTERHPVRRYLAWRFWTGNAEGNLVQSKLQKIIDEKDSLFEGSVIWRVTHGDQTAAPLIKLIIGRKPWLVRTLSNIWNEELKKFFSEWLRNRIEDKSHDAVEYGLELLELLDNEDAVQVLIAYWEKLKFHTRAIATALFLSTQETRSIADQEIRRLGFQPEGNMPDYYWGNINGVYFSEGDGLSDEKKANLLLLGEHFKHMHMHYGAKFDDMGERLTREKLESLLPYLSLFDSHSIYDFAVNSLRIGAADICYEKLLPQIRDEHFRNKIRLTTGELTKEIIYQYRELERKNTVYIDHWIEEFDKLGVTNEMLYEALKSFSEMYHTGKAFFIIALILEDVGIREHIPIMDDFTLATEEDRKSVEFWKANAVFAIKRRSLD